MGEPLQPRAAEAATDPVRWRLRPLASQVSSCAERDMGFDTSDNCLLGRPRALDAMLEQVRAALQP
jgi:hypothetical protein